LDIQQVIWDEKEGWESVSDGQHGSVVEKPIDAQLVVFFGSADTLLRHSVYESLSRRYPYAHVVGASAATQVFAGEVTTDSVVATAIRFKETQLRVVRADLSGGEQSSYTGRQIAEELRGADLRAVLLFSTDSVPDNNALVSSMSDALDPKVSICGLVAANGEKKAGVLCCDHEPIGSCVVAVGLYNPNLKMGHFTFHGGKAMGAEYLATRSERHEVYMLDDRPALDVFKDNLTTSQDDPFAWSKHPFRVRAKEHEGIAVLRTVKKINEEKRSFTLSCAIPQDRLLQQVESLDIATGEERASLKKRKLIHDDGHGEPLSWFFGGRDRVEAFAHDIKREAEMVSEALSSDVFQAGGYGEAIIMPLNHARHNRLHNFTSGVVTWQE
jgi:hypothetical protein